MAGITETVFRSICRKQGADIVVSEMISAEGINRHVKNTTSLIFFDASERPFGIQLFGAHPLRMGDAARYLEEHAQPDFIDLNAGCPVPKVVTRNGGSALLKDSKLFEQIVVSMVKAVHIPITVKIRSGWSTGEWVDTLYAKIAQENGAAAITLHPRSKTMGFSGHSFWERIRLVKQTVSIPVIGNGDILKPEDGLQMFSETGCDSIMIGRGSLGNPWIFHQIKEIMNGKTEAPVSFKEKTAQALFHLREYARKHGEKKASREMKKHLAWYIAKIPCASLFRNQIFRADSIEKLEEIIKEAFEN